MHLVRLQLFRDDQALCELVLGIRQVSFQQVGYRKLSIRQAHAFEVLDRVSQIESLAEFQACSLVLSEQS